MFCVLKPLFHVFVCYFFKMIQVGGYMQLSTGPSCPEAEVKDVYFDKGTRLAESVDFFFLSFVFPSSSCEPRMFIITQDTYDSVLIM